MPRRPVCLLVLALAVAGCGGSSEAKAPSATVGPPGTTGGTTSTAKALTPEEEVEAAYLRSWDVYAKAMRTLDVSQLGVVYADEALVLRREEVAGLEQANTPARMRVEHDYSISLLASDRALVVDSYRNHSVTLDPQTGEASEPDPNNLLRRKYDLRKEGGRWLVVRVTALS